MTYQLTPEMINSITDPEWAFSTERLLPAWEDIPEEFKKGNIYTELATALFYGTAMPECGIELHEGVEAEKLNRCIRAHLQSWGPKHEHKIAGVGFMISCASTLYPHDPDLLSRFKEADGRCESCHGIFEIHEMAVINGSLICQTCNTRTR